VTFWRLSIGFTVLANIFPNFVARGFANFIAVILKI
jgi:hypothetical protein